MLSNDDGFFAELPVLNIFILFLLLWCRCHCMLSSDAFSVYASYRFQGIAACMPIFLHLNVDFVHYMLFESSNCLIEGKSIKRWRPALLYLSMYIELTTILIMEDITCNLKKKFILKKVLQFDIPLIEVKYLYLMF